MARLSRERWQQVESLFEQALDRAPAERDVFVREACGDDETLRTEVMALLRADGSAGPLDGPLHGLAAGILEGAPSDRILLSLRPGDRIGPWRLVRRLGTGGMGVVFLAQREEGGFRQQVALKVVRDALAGGWLLRRFLEERRILAELDHPSIARLQDGGITADGLPWFAMELVEGESLVAYCDQRELALEERLRLFLDVCDAVAYAHRRLVVHRDLKPGNILVIPPGQEGARPRVKLLDFGIAKAVGPRPAVTGTLLPWLTPEYASPEQVRGEPVSTAGDIYSLGTILFELVTGRRPFQAEGRSPHRLLNDILEADPPAPSSVVPGRGRRLRGGVDAIVGMALRKEPDRRYGTVEALAADLRRYLAGFPVLALRGSRTYRVRRFVGRHWVPLAAAASVVAVGSGLGFAHTRAVAAERDQARAEADRADQVSAFLIDLFSQSDPLGVGMGPRPVTAFLAEGADRLRFELEEQPATRAALLRAVGKVYENLGEYDRAEELLAASLELRVALRPKGHPELVESLRDMGALRRRQGELAAADSMLALALESAEAAGARLAPGDLAAVLDEIGEVRRLQGELAEADSLFKEVVRLRFQAFGPADYRVANVLSSLGVVARQRGNLDAAEGHQRHALSVRRAHFGSHHFYVAESLRNLGVVLHAQGRYAEARDLYEEALEMQLRLLGEHHPQLGPTRNSYGALLRAIGDHAGAIEQYQSVLALQRAALGEAHPRLAASLTNFAVVVWDMGDLGLAEAVAREALAMREELLGSENVSTAHSRNALGVILRDAGRFAEAQAELLEADRIYRAALGTDHTFVAVNATALGRLELARSNHGPAEHRFREALAILERAGQSEHANAAQALHELGMTLVRSGRAAEGEPPLRRALEIRRAQLPPDHPDIAESMKGLQEALTAQGHSPEAVVLGAPGGG